MIFKRKIYKDLLEWKNSAVTNSALLIEGARRIGKTTIIEEFAKKEFPDYLLLDFSIEPIIVKSLFEDLSNINIFFQKLFAIKNKSLKPGSLIIFDEVQFCPKARQSIKFLVKDGRYSIIETGSLISIRENTKDIMIPSEERRLNMYPMDFEEFLWATEGDSQLTNLYNLTKSNNLDEKLHKVYLDKFRMYLMVGGMPKVLSIFLNTNSIIEANKEKEDILSLYKEDLRKYDKKHNTICSKLFSKIPSELGKENKRFCIKTDGQKTNYIKIQSSLSDLCDFKIVNRINSVTSLSTPLKFNEYENNFKLYYLDTGLLFYQYAKNSESNNENIKLLSGKSTANLGAIFENVVIQEIVSLNLESFYHTYKLSNNKKECRYELDSVFNFHGKTFVLEIKNSKRYLTQSLDHVKIKYPQIKLQKYIVGIKNYSKDSLKTTVPVYLIKEIFK